MSTRSEDERDEAEWQRRLDRVKADAKAEAEDLILEAFDPIEVAIGETMARRIFAVEMTPENRIEAARQVARTVKAYRDEIAKD